MKRAYISFLCLHLSAIFVVADESVFTSYQDWQFTPVTVADTNAGVNVRDQMDFTKPLHGPWLLNPSADSITINWITRIPCAVALDYRQKGEEEFKRVWKKTYGRLDYSSDMHTFHISGLKAGTEYEYRLANTMDKQVAAYTHVVTGREIYSFKTTDTRAENYKVFVTADFHGSARLSLDPMIKATDGLNASLYFFLGDNVEDNMNNARYYITFGFLDDVCRLWGKEKATLFLRGNHDFHGLEAHKWGDFFPRSDGKSYQAFSHGPALFVCLDTMASRAGSQINQEINADYLREQAEWIENLKKSEEWKRAKFRVAMGHFATHGGEQTDMMTNVFKRVLNDSTAEGRIHLYLCGHEHRYTRINPLSDTTKVNPQYSPRYPKITPDFNYTEVICGLCESMIIEVSPEKLTVKSIDWQKKSAPLIDHFEIYPDGKIKELMKTAEFVKGAKRN